MAADTADRNPGAPGGDDAAGLATGTGEVATNFGSTGVVDGGVTGGLEPVSEDRAGMNNAGASGAAGLGNAGAAGNTGAVGAGGTGAPGGGAGTEDTVGTTPPAG